MDKNYDVITFSKYSYFKDTLNKLKQCLKTTVKISIKVIRTTNYLLKFNFYLDFLV